MTRDEFVKRVMEEVVETPEFAAEEKKGAHSIMEWNSLNLLIVAAIVVETFDFELNNEEIRACQSLDEIYNLAKSKTET